MWTKIQQIDKQVDSFNKKINAKRRISRNDSLITSKCKAISFKNTWCVGSWIQKYEWRRG